jgi:tripartite-type tricarboxylate transporter receptor subunit TctC
VQVRRAALLCAAVAAAAAVVVPCAQAQSYPSKPIRMIVPFPAGGGSDSTARILAQRLQDRLKQTFLIENRTGAGGAIGLEAVARAAPDGYTTLLGSGSEIVMLPAVATGLSFDTLKDFVAIARVADVPLLEAWSGASRLGAFFPLTAAVAAVAVAGSSRRRDRASRAGRTTLARPLPRDSTSQ